MEKKTKIAILIIGLILLIGSIYFVSAEITPSLNINLLDRFGIQNNPFASPQIVFSNLGTANGNGIYSCTTTEDCQPKIQAAIAALDSKRGNIAFCGTFRVNNTILLNRTGINLIGCGWGGSRVTFDNGAQIRAMDGFPLGSNVISTNPSSNVVKIEGLMIRGNYRAKNCIEGLSGRMELKDIVASECLGAGIYFQDEMDSDSYVDNVFVSNNNIGIETHRADNRYNSIFARNNTYTAWYLASDSQQITNTHVYGNGWGLVMNGSDYVQIKNGIFESDKQGEILITSPSSFADEVDSFDIQAQVFNGNNSYIKIVQTNTNEINGKFEISSDGDVPLFNVTGDNRYVNIQVKTQRVNDEDLDSLNYNSPLIESLKKYQDVSYTLLKNYRPVNFILTNGFAKERVVLSFDFRSDEIINGENITDNSKNNYLGISNNSAFSSFGGINDGGYIGFNGEDGSMLSINQDTSSLINTSESFSMNVWLKTDHEQIAEENRTYTIISKNDNTFPYAWFSIRNQVPQFRMSDTGDDQTYQISTSEPRRFVNDSQWHMVSFTFNGTFPIMYIDGRPVGNVFGGFEWDGHNDPTSNIIIGATSNGTSSFNGSIGGVLVVNKTLTPEEILYLYENRYKTESNTLAKGGTVQGILTLAQPPVTCPAGSFMTYFNGATSTCVSPSATSYTNLTATNMTILSNLIFTNSTGTPKWRLYVNDSGSLITESI
jgi:hypothetical protein